MRSNESTMNKNYAKWYYDEKSELIILSLGPGDYLVDSINVACKSIGFDTGVVLCGIGSFNKVNFHYFGKNTESEEKFELLSLSGTVIGGVAHLHVVLIDSGGMLIGGHLYEGRIYTVGEVAIAKTGMKLTRGRRDESELDLICGI